MPAVRGKKASETARSSGVKATTLRLWLPAAAVLLAIAGAASYWGGDSDSTAEVSSGPRRDGQWIWTRTDARSFEELAKDRSALVPAVHVATMKDDLVAHRALSPAVAGPREVALVVRFDDSFHRVWEAAPPTERVIAELLRVVAEARATGVTVTELQLDYDAPVRRLPEWAALVRQVATRVDVSIWVTSIPAHLRDPHYGERLRGAVAGHVIQLFDTGLPCSQSNAAELGAQLRRHALPFRVGVGAFERRRGKRVSTEHGCWARAAHAFDVLPGMRGRMVFPAAASALTVAALLEEPES